MQHAKGFLLLHLITLDAQGVNCDFSGSGAQQRQPSLSSAKLYLCLIHSVDNIVKYDSSVHTLNSATHHIELIRAGIWCEETSQEETNKQT